MNISQLCTMFEQYISGTHCYSKTRTKNMLNKVSLELRKRDKMLVTEGIERIRPGFAYVIERYTYCPRCRTILEREYILYCYVCGQALKWISLGKIKYAK